MEKDLQHLLRTPHRGGLGFAVASAFHRVSLDLLHFTNRRRGHTGKIVRQQIEGP
jgi:hypothetical protein